MSTIGNACISIYDWVSIKLTKNVKYFLIADMKNINKDDEWYYNQRYVDLCL